MVLRPVPYLRKAIDEEHRWQTAAFLFCFAFGVAMIANTFGTADGMWFWYADLLRNGELLYSHLHVALQPLFVLETAWFMGLLGKSWLASKVPAVLHLAGYLLAIFWIAHYLPLADKRKAILILVAFVASVSDVAFRFDDYSVMAELFVLLCIALLLKLHKGVRPGREQVLIGLLGVCTGLCVVTRVTNGAALFLAVGIAIFAVVPERRWVSLALFGAAAALTAVLIVFLTGDSLRDYWTYTVTKAAGAKGGTGSVLLNPVLMPKETWLLVIQALRGLVVLYLLICLVWAFVLRPATIRRSKRPWVNILLGAVLVLVPLAHYFHRGLLNQIFIIAVGTLAVFCLYACGLVVLFRLFWREVMGRRLASWSPLETLLLIAWGQLAALAMSTGGRFGEVYAPLAMLFLLLPIASPIELRERGRSFLLAGALALSVSACIHRVREPYRWLGVHALPMFKGRQWYRHPVYGPMYIESGILEFIQPVCANVTSTGGAPQLLSLPYSFANYFCDVPPWRGYVQTWFDTSSRETIVGLSQQLQTAPPKWIFYQRQLDALTANEETFNGGRPLPHRDLDRIIQEKLMQGSWKAAYRSSYGTTDSLRQEWLLMATAP